MKFTPSGSGCQFHNSSRKEVVKSKMNQSSDKITVPEVTAGPGESLVEVVAEILSDSFAEAGYYTSRSVARRILEGLRERGMV